MLTEHTNAKPGRARGRSRIVGKTIPYDAFAGPIAVHPKGCDDVPQNAEKDEKNTPGEASMV